MVEFETTDGQWILVNPAQVKAVCGIPNAIGCFMLVMEYFPIIQNEGAQQVARVMQHAINVKAETRSDITRKLGGKPEIPPPLLARAN